MRNIILFLLLASCSSSPHRVEKFKDISLSNSYDVGHSETLGLNKDQELVIQRKRLLSEEYRRMKYDVFGLEARIYGVKEYGSVGLYGVYLDCLEDLASNTRDYPYIEDVDKVTGDEVELRVGLEESEIIGLEESFYKDKMDQFKSYKRILLKREQEFEKKIAVCKFKKRVRIAGGE